MLQSLSCSLRTDYGQHLKYHMLLHVGALQYNIDNPTKPLELFEPQTDALGQTFRPRIKKRHVVAAWAAIHPTVRGRIW